MSFSDLTWMKGHRNIAATWWRYQRETFSALLAICAGNSPVTGEFPAQRPVTRSFDVFFDLLSKQSWGWWFETLSRPLWRHCNECDIPYPGVNIDWVSHKTLAKHLFNGENNCPLESNSWYRINNPVNTLYFGGCCNVGHPSLRKLC